MFTDPWPLLSIIQFKTRNNLDMASRTANIKSTTSRTGVLDATVIQLIYVSAKLQKLKAKSHKQEQR